MKQSYCRTFLVLLILLLIFSTVFGQRRRWNRRNWRRGRPNPGRQYPSWRRPFDGKDFPTSGRNPDGGTQFPPGRKPGGGGSIPPGNNPAGGGKFPSGAESGERSGDPKDERKQPFTCEEQTCPERTVCIPTPILCGHAYIPETCQPVPMCHKL